MEPDEMQAIATDEGESYTPPTPMPRARPASAPQAAIPEAEGPPAPGGIGMPDFSGDAPDIAKVPLREGLRRMGSQHIADKDAFAAEAADRFAGPAARERVGNTLPGRGVKAIVNYLMGGNASPAMVDEAAQQVDPQGQMRPADRNLKAVAQVAETQGDEAAFQLAQANRVAYNAKQAFAYAALNGSPQKIPDLNAAVKAANQAQENVLDGSNVEFAPSQNGVTATVTGADGRPRQINLSLDAFREFLNPGKEGQLDKLLDKGTPALLERLAAGPRPQAQPRRFPTPKEQSQDQDSPAMQADERKIDETNFGKTPSTMNLSGSNKVQYGSMDPPENPTLEQRAQKMFPGITQGAEAERWMAGERRADSDAKNRLDVAQVKSDVAEINAAAKRDVEEKRGATARAVAEQKAQAWANRDERKMDLENRKLEQRMREMQSRQGNAQLHEQMANIRAKRMTMTPLDDQEKELYKRVMGMDPPSLERDPQGPAPQTQPAKPSGNQSRAQSPKDQQALAWANANPQDPRAAKIKAQLGVQ